MKKLSWSDTYSQMMYDRGVHLSSWPSTVDGADPLRVIKAEAKYREVKYTAEGKTRAEAYEKILAQLLAEHGPDFFEKNPIRDFVAGIVERLKELPEVEKNRVVELLNHLCPECYQAGYEACTCPPVPMSPDAEAATRMHEVVSGLPLFTLLAGRPESEFWKWYEKPKNRKKPFRHRVNEPVLFLGMHHGDPTRHCAVMSLESGVIAWRVHPEEYRPLAATEIQEGWLFQARRLAARFSPAEEGPFPWCTVLELGKGEFIDWDTKSKGPELLYLGIDPDNPAQWLASNWEGKIVERDDAHRFTPESFDDDD